PPAKLRGKTADDIPTLVSGMWHFPTVSSKKSAEAELKELFRELAPKTNLGKNGVVALPKIRHAVTYRKVAVLPFLVRVAKLPTLAGGKKLPLANVLSQSISNLTRKIARAALHAQHSNVIDS